VAWFLGSLLAASPGAADRSDAAGRPREGRYELARTLATETATAYEATLDVLAKELWGLST
jgi:hypothetical protein